MLKVILSGCTGKMGNTVEKIIDTSDDLKIVMGFGINDSENKKNKYPILNCPPNNSEKVGDVIIDFSSKDCLNDLLKYAKDTKTPIVLATTGYTEDDHISIMEASKYIPIFQSYNMSYGVALLKKMSKMLAEKLGDEFDIEIIEKHHKEKKDAPSGTAYMIAESINNGLKNNRIYKFGRDNTSGKRSKDEIGIHAIRGGTMTGEHTVIYAGESEVIEITHKSESRDLFANGAIRAAKFLVNQKNGIYTMDDLC